MSEIIGPETDDSNSPILDYVRVRKDGTERAVWHHPEKEPILGSELDSIEDLNEWSLKWYCPKCGAVDPLATESKPAGMGSVHIPCVNKEVEAATEQEHQPDRDIQIPESLAEDQSDEK